MRLDKEEEEEKKRINLEVELYDKVYIPNEKSSWLEWCDTTFYSKDIKKLNKMVLPYETRAI